MARSSIENASGSTKGSSSGGSSQGSSKGSSKGAGEGPNKGKLIAVGVVFGLLILAVIYINLPDSSEDADRKAQEEINAASANEPVPEQKSAEQN